MTCCSHCGKVLLNVWNNFFVVAIQLTFWLEFIVHLIDTQRVQVTINTKIDCSTRLLPCGQCGSNSDVAGFEVVFGHDRMQHLNIGVEDEHQCLSVSIGLE